MLNRCCIEMTDGERLKESIRRCQPRLCSPTKQWPLASSATEAIYYYRAKIIPSEGGFFQKRRQICRKSITHQPPVCTGITHTHTHTHTLVQQRRESKQCRLVMAAAPNSVTRIPNHHKTDVRMRRGRISK